MSGVLDDARKEPLDFATTDAMLFVAGKRIVMPKPVIDEILRLRDGEAMAKVNIELERKLARDAIDALNQRISEWEWKYNEMERLYRASREEADELRLALNSANERCAELERKMAAKYSSLEIESAAEDISLTAVDAVRLTLGLINANRVRKEKGITP